jgi:hypothetical protein
VIVLFDRGQRVDGYAYSNGPLVAYAVEYQFGWSVVTVDKGRVVSSRTVGSKKAAVYALGLLGEGCVIWNARAKSPVGVS